DSVVQTEGDQSPVWDAIYSSIELFDDGPERRILFVLTDGKASGNVHGFDEARRRVQEAKVVVYAANSGQTLHVKPHDDLADRPAARLRALAEATGGEYAEPD